MDSLFNMDFALRLFFADPAHVANLRIAVGALGMLAGLLVVALASVMKPRDAGSRATSEQLLSDGYRTRLTRWLSATAVLCGAAVFFLAIPKTQQMLMANEAGDRSMALLCALGGVSAGMALYYGFRVALISLYPSEPGSRQP